MSTELLFYQNLAAISSTEHKNLCIKGGEEFKFARNTNSVPLMSVEITKAALNYPIVFAGDEKNFLPVSVLGIKDGQNLYVDRTGKWKAKYIPAFVRRYPFVFSTNDEGQTFTLCIDEKFSGCNTDGEGERLFDDAGEKTPYLENVLTFLQDYQKEFVRTQAFVTALKELDILEPMTAQVTLADGQQMALAGFLSVSREKLKNLPAEKLSELAKNEALELIYIHLQSLNNFQKMFDAAGSAEIKKKANAEKAAPKTTH